MKACTKNIAAILISIVISTSCTKEDPAIEMEPQPASISEITTPRYSVLAGAYSSDQSVELYTITEGSTIYYTMDGTEPTTSSLEYTDPIVVSGHGTIVEIRAIASFDGGISAETSSYYKIDLHHTPTIYATGLSITEIKNNMVGDWIGNVTTPWVAPQNVVFMFNSDGTYSGKALTATNFAYPTEFWGSALYYGSDIDHESKTYNIYDVQADGKATADITIYFHENSTNVDRLRHISFSPDGNYLEFELWHHMTYGPIKYKLTRYQESSTEKRLAPFSSRN